MKRVLLIAAKTGYQVREFHSAADRIGVELVLATDRCHVLDDPWADQATPIDFARPEPGIAALEQRGPFDGILAVGDAPAYGAAQAAERLGLRFHPAEAVRAANDKFLTRERFRAAGLNVPEYQLAGEPSRYPCPRRYPCIVKPLHSSASRGVIRADNCEEFEQASARIRKMTDGGPILVEDFIPGREFALEGLLTAGCLTALALFDKPDPLDGPYFEETIYVTPSRENSQTQREIVETVQRAASALGLADGPVHAEMRVNSKGVWMLETAARPIGGLCARALRFELGVSTFRAVGLGKMVAQALACEAEACSTLEQLLLLHALGEDVSRFLLAPAGHGVMMIPIPRSGVFLGAEGIEEARQIAGIAEIEVTAKEGQQLQALPEGATYLGFIFSRARSPEEAERALRLAHARLRLNIGQSLPVVT